MAKTRKPKRGLKAEKQETAEEEVWEAPGSYFIRFPPERVEMSFEQWKAKDWPALQLITELKGSASELSDPEFMAGATINWETKQFKAWRDPVALLKAFCAAVDVGVYPPISILEAVAASFTRYTEAQGRQSLDQTFNLQTQKGQRSSFTKRSKRGLEEFVASLIYECKLVLGVSTDEAARRVARHLQRHHAAFQLTYTPQSLARLYPIWKARFRFDENDTSHFDHPDNPLSPRTPERLAQYLAMYGARPVKKSPPVPRQRDCLQCGRPFSSLGAEHRICARCKRRSTASG
jgi:hypothetical protein